MGRSQANSDARDRILAAADRLFYAEGFRAVGIDRVIAESAVAKMTLYAHFRSKDDLLLAVLRYREAQFVAWFDAAIGRHGGEQGDRFDAFFGALGEWFATPTFRGCAFINAAVELADPAHPGAQFVRQQKDRFRAFLARTLVAALGDQAAGMTPAIFLLVEGAIVTALIEGSAAPAEVAHAAARRLVQSR